MINYYLFMIIYYLIMIYYFKVTVYFIIIIYLIMTNLWTILSLLIYAIDTGHIPITFNPKITIINHYFYGD